MSTESSSVHQSRPSQTLLWLVSLGFFMQNLDATIVNTALPTMAKELNESTLHMQWVLISYMLTNAMVIPSSGWLADRFGTRRVFSCAIILFISGSLLCAQAHNLNLLIAGRIIQGAGAALLVPVGRLAVLRTYPKGQFLKAMSFVLVPGIVGQLIGPSLGGFLVEYFSWKWIFLINLPIGVMGIFVTLRHMPELRAEHLSSFDFLGYLLLAIAMVTWSLCLDGIGILNLKWGSILVFFLVGLLAIIYYILHARQLASPLFSRRLFKHKTFNIGVCGNIFARIGSGGMPFMLPLFLQLILGYTPAQAGLMMLPVAISSIVTKRLLIHLIQWFGYRSILISNTVFLGLCIAGFALMERDQPLIARIIYMAIFGALNSLQFSVMSTVTLKDLNSETASSGNTMLSMTQMLSMSMGVSIASTVLHLLSTHFSTMPLISAFHGTFIIIGVSSCLAALIFSRLPKDT